MSISFLANKTKKGREEIRILSFKVKYNLRGLSSCSSFTSSVGGGGGDELLSSFVKLKASADTDRETIAIHMDRMTKAMKMYTNFYSCVTVSLRSVMLISWYKLHKMLVYLGLKSWIALYINFVTINLRFQNM